MFENQIQYAFVIQDSKTEIYSYPIFSKDLGALEQHLEVCCMTGVLKHNPEDFALFMHGHYEPETGDYIQLDKPKFISTLTKYRKGEING